ncbi:MAG: RNA-binding protein [Candidatus Saccharibacteria bacterium]|nr:RNA-binding protein [Candidatus Saccharibacteria bacterium]
MSMKLYVGGLPYSMTDKELEEMFSKHGNVESVTIIKDRDSGQSKGFGFVEMTEIKDGQTAIKELNDSELAGRKITVNQARERDEKPRNGGGSFRRSY